MNASKIFPCYTLVAVLILALNPCLALADSFEDGKTAYDKGNYTLALEHFSKAAEQGNAWAQHNLGVMYDNGQGVSQDYAQAAKWYRKAAEQGDVDAQASLGLMYALGQGTAQDLVQAHKWLNLIAIQGDADAEEARDLIATEMSPAQIKEAQKLAREWTPKKTSAKP